MVFSTFSRGKSFDSPGPGSYSIPSSFGNGPRYTFKGRYKEKEPDIEPQMLKQPSTLIIRNTTFGRRGAEKPPDITPAPNKTYVPFGSDGRKCSIQSKFDDPPNTNPGPADYTISREFQSPQQTISSGKRYEPVDPNLIADPGSIKLPSTLNRKKTVTIGELIPIPDPDIPGPGPGKYRPKQTMGYETPRYSFPKGPRDEKYDTNPSPAEYQKIRPLSSGSKLGTTVKNRTPNFLDPVRFDCDYRYYPTMTPRKVSHGKRPATSYETMSPGPIYNQKSSFEKKPITIGSKHKYKDPLLDNPSPVDYFKIPPVEKEQLICGFYGPTDRSIINSEKERNKPGPASYTKKRELDEFKTGFYFTSRKMEDFVPDTDGSYVAPYSTLGGPKYTIGNKETY